MPSDDNVTNLEENDTNNLDEMILKVLNSNPFIRRDKLIELLKKEKMNLASMTLQRHLNWLIKEGSIIKISSWEATLYGIPRTDGRASYYALAKYKEFPRYNNILLESLKSSNLTRKRMALIEIESMKQISMLPNHLKEITNMLKEENDYEIKQAVLRILYNSFLNFIFPSDLKIFEENIASFFIEVNSRLEKEKYQNNEERTKDENTKSHILFLLGLLNSKKVIEFLKGDVSVGKDLETLKREGYTAWALAKVIDENRAELLEFQNKLNSDNHIKVLQNIRIEANTYLHTPVFGLKGSAYNNHISIFKSKGLQI